MMNTIFDGNHEALDALGPPDTLRFLAHSKGWAVDKNTFFGRVIVPVSENPLAEELAYEAKLFHKIQPIPAEILGRTLGFFRAAWNQRESEAMVYLLVRDGEYDLHVPKQNVSHGGVHAKFDAAELPPGSRVVGDIHSHCNFNAFHSGTDTADAAKNDGLHITIGKVDTDEPEWAVMLAYSGYLWDLESLAAVTANPRITPIDPPAEWLARIDEPPPAPPARTYGRWIGSEDWNDYLTPKIPQTINRSPATASRSYAWWSIDELADSNYMSNLTEEEAEDLTQVRDALEIAENLLYQMGVEMGVEFYPYIRTEIRETQTT